jgi:hypothetical protein
MFHLCAFTESVAALTNTDITALNDDVLTISNTHFLPQQDLPIIFAAATGLLLDRARLVSPTNRLITLPHIVPVMLGDTIPTPPAVADYRANPFRLRGLEEFALEATTTAAGPSQVTGLIALQPSYEPMPAGNVFTLRGTSTTAAVAVTWTTIAMTWADILPEGVYAIVGGYYVAATPLAFRLIVEGQIWRPGGIGVALSTGLLWNPQLKGGLGVWGRFKPTAMPQVQVLNTAAVAVHTIYLDIMRVL